MGPVDNLAVHLPRNISHLGRREFIIKDHGIHLVFFYKIPDLFQQPGTHEGSRIGPGQLLDELPYRLSSGRFSQGSQFLHMGLGIFFSIGFDT
jgi:hypothetical protein